MKDKTKTLWAVMTFPIQYSSRELLPNADIDLALFQTAQGWSDTQASVTVGRHRGLTDARDPVSVNPPFRLNIKDDFQKCLKGAQKAGCSPTTHSSHVMIATPF